jgi:CubicO group peptidase (beta-lactamase class C family)
MTSGVYNYVRSKEAAVIQSTDPTLPFSYEEIMTTVLKYQPYGTPMDFRTTANYSELASWLVHPKADRRALPSANTNYIMLGHILENVTGVSNAEYIDTNLLGPLAINGDTFWPDDSFELGTPHSEGYGPWPLTSMTTYGNKTYSNPSQALSAGAYVSNLKSMKTWIEATVTGYGYGGYASPLHGERTKGYVHPLGQPLPLNVTFEYGYGLMKLNDYCKRDKFPPKQSQ